MENNNSIEYAEKISLAVKEHGGRVYYVGGCVRDKLRGYAFDDIDIEVHGIAPECLDNILSSFGHKCEMGVSFGIWGLDGVDIDIAMPRTEEATGRGHRSFKTFVDPYIGTTKAAERRDFTVNAILEDVLTHEIIDPYNGRADLEAGILRHVNDNSFAEDPLRVLRAAGFGARFNFQVAKKTKELCESMDIKTLSRERIFAELEKALLKSDKPSVFFDFLRGVKKLDFWFKEVSELENVVQSPKFHSEGDVYNHTMLALDGAAKLRERANYPLAFMLSALVHDFGKIITTEEIDGKIHAYRHEIEGLKLVESFISRLTDNKKLKAYLLNMTKLHMRPNMMVHQKAGQKSLNKLFDEAISPSDLLLLAEVDYHSSIHEGTNLPYDDIREFLNFALKEFEKTMAKPHVTGEDLICAGIKPSKNFSEILEFSHKLRLADVPKEQALKQVLSEARKCKQENGISD